ncbi:hypothetical protein ACFQRL_02185 [Microbacterium fluvii]|uniref:Lipoprotein n=1 Tax=Microbacterium fluvii TaxID=415215 RepID=A0ABW2H8X6_9MICO|nr:hypothetical protein [Microbacterium fluvii]MCU4671399.1 hypothetical protein [Microbacterium fluvii]
MRRRILIAALGAVVALSGCAPQPSGGDVAGGRWTDATLADYAADTAVVGTISGRTSPAGQATVGMTFDLETLVDRIEIACFGGGTAQFDVLVFADNGATSDVLDVDCTGVPGSIAYDGFLTDVTRVRFATTRHDRAVPFTAAAFGQAFERDEWQDYFEIDGADIHARSRMSGGFGPPGAVYPLMWRDGTLDPGLHIVRVECAGPARVFATISGDTSVEPHQDPIAITCGSRTEIGVEVVDQLSIDLDSGGEQGAFAVEIDPED